MNYTSGEATGQLTFTPVADAYGTAVVTVRVEDDGGTENGGIDTVIVSFDVCWEVNTIFNTCLFCCNNKRLLVFSYITSKNLKKD